MSTTISLQVTPFHLAPRAAVRLGEWLAAGLARLESRSATPASDSRTEADRVREMAHQYQRTDPSFAADLFAAADRHEAQLGN